ncbi:MAG: DUF1553 domain-containing protein [Bryobacterales bacterium]|nr:DUF1553 domain-containing protein [Bryobacterales bacterium]
MRDNCFRLTGAMFAVLACGFSQTSDAPEALGDDQAPVLADHAECLLFGPRRERLLKTGVGEKETEVFVLSSLTEGVATRLAFVPGGSRTDTSQKYDALSTIDRYLFADMQANGATPADITNDFEFIRRATLDITGRIPTPGRVISFTSDASPGKRAKLIDELLASPEYTDKWAMYFGDLYSNRAGPGSVGIQRFNEGRNAFYSWIRAAVGGNKPYNQIAVELISAKGSNSYAQGELNWMVGGVVTGGPQQDIWDAQTVAAMETFLGLGHVNCLLCHNGRGHLDSLSLWGKSATRAQAWGLASFMSHAAVVPVREANVNNPRYSVEDDTRYRTDYALNTTTGNRPTRAPIGTQRTVPPVYLFSGAKPDAGETYRAAFSKAVTSDFQFARATVNYIWKEYFGRGIVDPVNQFDPARLDPDNPPQEPWTLQPSNARLLNALAKDFVNTGYDLKALMRQIANSQSYQLSSRYNGQWNPAWEKLFARKLVRRLWAEEIHDAMVQSSNVKPNYNIRGFTDQPGFAPVSFAMQFPETINMPDGGGSISQFLDSFLRGNRDEDERRQDGSLLQALDMMNDNFVMSRIRATPAGVSLLSQNINLPDDQLVNNLFLAVLSRYPNDAEKATALASLKSGTRAQKAENLLWSLYNKVDFLFNY